jgi:hypothetical protein
MQIPVLVEPVGSKGYRATSAPFGFSCEGATSTEAVQNFRAKIEQHLTAGALLVPLDIAENPNPWVRFGGMFKDDPIFEEVLEIMAKNRRRDDSDQEVP